MQARVEWAGYEPGKELSTREHGRIRMTGVGKR